jgi:hypothetical protein
MLQCRSNSQHSMSLAVEETRVKWDAANKAASELRTKLSQLEGHGMNPEARMIHEGRLQAARDEVEWRFREYYDLGRQETELRMLGLQKSQQRAAWASFAVAAVSGVATILNYIF